ncbi:conserved hypothetical protein [Neospora caninum Liverpool]|uniref:Uncharacterized protein n=1 Tax=Neospora caninum (strain Liverpool) TaxID=572307 RepID=F0VF40_NEOCL|nr:conserved hypothetical protein [Neospora caninum Liverpool]CBZ52334.1 conserved hypothetical protein [Neospora caninum Liverpool]CEL66302.1 TPA: hypothetical protein BN1204_021220 [Neospora caninum Liverpool]|eukprot:XP_003882366.1 conserved hypothetical protein [Neospora caninum Liverpool]
MAVDSKTPPASLSPSVQGAVRHLVRALQQHEAAVEELETQIAQHEAASSLLSHYLSACFHSPSCDAASGVSPASPHASTSPSLPSVSAESSVASSPCPRIFIPLTTEAILPGYLLPSASPPLLHLGGDYLSTFRLGSAPCTSCASPAKPLASAGVAGAPAARGETGKTGNREESAECGALGLLHRREAMLREQEKVVKDKVRKLRMQLQIGEEERLRRGAGASTPSGVHTPGKTGTTGESADEENQKASGRRGQAHFTRDGFVEIVEEYTSDEDEAEAEKQKREEPSAGERQDAQRQVDLDSGSEARPSPSPPVGEPCPNGATAPSRGGRRESENKHKNEGTAVAWPPPNNPETPPHADTNISGERSTPASQSTIPENVARSPSSSSAPASPGFGGQRREGEKCSSCSWSPAVSERVVERQAREERGAEQDQGRMQFRGKDEGKTTLKEEGSLRSSLRETEHVNAEGAAQPTKKVSLFKAMRQNTQN